MAYTEEQKRNVLEKIKSGVLISVAAREVGVHPATVGHWLKKQPKVKRTYRKRATPKVLTLQMPEEKTPLIILMGDAKEVGSALQRLAEIRGVK